MHLQLIRNATMRFEYAGKRFVTDPYLAARHTLPSYRGVSPNPTVDLPCPPSEVLEGIEMAVISHLHSDHFDPAARRLLPKEMTILCQPGDEATLEAKGFLNVLPLEGPTEWNGIEITRTPGRHGTGEVLKDMGKVSGFVFRAKDEPSVYWAGDTIWCEEVARAISQYRPDIIITHSGGAVWGSSSTLIIMNAAQTAALCHAAPESTVIAVHMESLDHTTVTREELRKHAEAGGISPQQLLIPADREKFTFLKGLTI